MTEACSLVSPTGCRWCGGELTGRRRVWCCSECEAEWQRHHVWQMARPAVLQRDGWRCVRCGHVGWRMVPEGVLALGEEPYVRPPDLEDWAVALGYMTPHEAVFGGDWAHYQQTKSVRQAALERLPDSIVELVRSEGRQQYWRPPRWLVGHELEVNHVEPRRGAGYQAGCHHHQEGLETLCRPCHADESTRQRMGLPSWRQDPRPRAVIIDGWPAEQLTLEGP